MLRNQKGFTLIEIIAVLVILGILAAVAIPKYMGLQQASREAAVDGMKGAIWSAASLAYGKCSIKGISNGACTIEGTSTVTLSNSYPNAATITNALSAYDGFTAAAGVFSKDGAPTPAACSVTYAPPAAANGQPSITATKTGC